MQDPDELLREGIRIIRDERDMARGRQLITQSLKLNPNNDAGWVWLARVTSDAQRKMQCLDRALKINPNNNQARQLKQHLQAQSASEDQAASREKQNQPEAKATPQNQLLATFSIRPGSQLKWAVFALALILVSLMFFPPGGQIEGHIFGFFVAAVTAAGALWYITQLAWTLGNRITITDDTLTLRSLTGKQSWRWDEFTAVQIRDRVLDRTSTLSFMGGLMVGGLLLAFAAAQAAKENAVGLSVHTSYHLKLFIDQKCVLRVGTYYRNFLALGALIEQETAPRLSAAYYERILAGETIRFKNIELTKQQFSGRNEVIQWRNIARVVVERGSKRRFLIIYHGDGKAAYILDDLVNANVLLTLIEKLGGVVVSYVQVDSAGNPVRPDARKTRKKRR